MEATVGLEYLRKEWMHVWRLTLFLSFIHLVTGGEQL